jgi:hypothetical protein
MQGTKEESTEWHQLLISRTDEPEAAAAAKARAASAADSVRGCPLLTSNSNACLPRNSRCKRCGQCCGMLKCVRGKCMKKERRCSEPGSVCSNVMECCSRVNKVCEGPARRPRTCKVCRVRGARCKRDSQCCSSLKCFRGRCRKKDKLCLGPGDVCTNVAQCCNSVSKVCEGAPGSPKTCQVCQDILQTCVRETQCCRGLGCFGGICRETETRCKKINQQCSDVTACCFRDVVCEGPEGRPTTCKQCLVLNASCKRSSQCCSGLKCRNGNCRRPGR